MAMFTADPTLLRPRSPRPSYAVAAPLAGGGAKDIGAPPPAKTGPDLKTIGAVAGGALLLWLVTR